jgi:hypothetical protein
VIGAIFFAAGTALYRRPNVLPGVPLVLYGSEYPVERASTRQLLPLHRQVSSPLRSATAMIFVPLIASLILPASMCHTLTSEAGSGIALLDQVARLPQPRRQERVRPVNYEMELTRRRGSGFLQVKE